MIAAEDNWFNYLGRAFEANRLGHAILLSYSGDEQPIAYKQIAEFRAFLLCQNPAKLKSCGQCESCLILKQEDGLGAHPDSQILEAESELAGFDVEQVRHLIKSFSMAHSLSPNRVVWIRNAELLSKSQAASANALLKLLEEPKQKSFLILSTANMSSLLPTIRSRCHHFRIPPNPKTNPSDSKWMPFFEQGWTSLFEWLGKANFEKLSRIPTTLPADEDSFWKDRASALEQLLMLKSALWAFSKQHWSHYEAQKAAQLTDFFEAFDDLIYSIRSYGNPLIQWLNFRSRMNLHGNN